MNGIREPALTLEDALAERDAARLELGRLRLQQEMLLSISGTMDLVALVELLKKQILTLRGVDGVVLTMLDSQAENLVMKGVRYPEEFRYLENTFLNYRIPLTEAGNPHIAALLERQPQVADAVTGNEANRLMLSRWNLRQAVVWPIVAEGEAVGTVMLLCQSQALPMATRQQVEMLLELFHQPLWHAQRYDHLHQQKLVFDAAATEQERFLKFVTEVSGLNVPDRIYEMISEELMRRMSFEVAAIFIEQDGLLECCKTVPKSDFFGPQARSFQATCSADPVRIDVMDGGVAISFIRDIPLVFPDIKPLMSMSMPEKSRSILSSLGTPRTMITMPIRDKGRPIGVLGLISLVEPVTVGREDLRFFELLSSFFGAAISNAHTFELAEGQSREIRRLNLILQDKVDELADQVATDKLTGLYNFRTFEQELMRRVNEYQRNSLNEGLSIVMVDIDHFKRFNDEHGHAAGNVVLAGVANEVAQLSRKMDLACRYGGEEFVVILPKCLPEGALTFAERVRARVEAARFRIESGAELSVTVSVGVATFSESDTQAALFERADQALYRAKRAGRNRVSA